MRIAGRIGLVLLAGCGRAASSPPHNATPGTGAVATVVPGETDARVSRVEELLRGVPGLEVTALSNGAYQIRIRGHRSIRGNPGDDDPLIVIDGIPSAAGASARAGISPADAGRGEGPKDGGATGQYGSLGPERRGCCHPKRGRHGAAPLTLQLPACS